MSAQMSAAQMSSSAANYRASSIKRARATKAAVEERRLALYSIVANMQPMTVRQVFYQAPTQPTKASDTRAKNFGHISVELNAIDPDRLRSLVADAIENHLPKQQFAILKAAEERERDIIRQLVGDAVIGSRQ
jgi:hypothetical protein